MPAPKPPEFRRRAVELARLRERPIGQIAKDLQISESCLRRWMDLTDVEDGHKQGLTSDERRSWCSFAVIGGCWSWRTRSSSGRRWGQLVSATPSMICSEVWHGEDWSARTAVAAAAAGLGDVAGREFDQRDLPGGGLTAGVDLLDPAAVWRVYQPPQRRRPGTLTLAEREELSRGLAAGESYRAIGRRLGRSASTISREVAKNKGPRRYRAVDAPDDRAWRRARRPKRCLLARRPALRKVVSDRLRADWSPQQISGWLTKQHSAGSEMRVSHEMIYKTLFIQSRGVLAKNLQKHLRSGRPIRRSVHNTVTGQWRSQITEAVSIRERPAEVADRAVPGH